MSFILLTIISVYCNMIFLKWFSFLFLFTIKTILISKHWSLSVVQWHLKNGVVFGLFHMNLMSVPVWQLAWEERSKESSHEENSRCERLLPLVTAHQVKLENEILAVERLNMCMQEITMLKSVWFVLTVAGCIQMSFHSK